MPLKIYIIIFISMFFAHIIDDYYLQGILAKLKQKSWWEENTANPLYKNDYIIALIMHGLSWSIMIHIPIIIAGFIYKNDNYILGILVSIIINMLIHSWIDNFKANKKIINLCQDQLIHICQIIITYIFMMLI